MAAQDNPYFIQPASPLQALITGVQGYDRAAKAAKEREVLAGRQDAMSALQGGGDTRGALARLIGIGDVQGAKAIADFAEHQANRDFRISEAARSQGNADRSFGFQQHEATRTQANADRAFNQQQTQFNAQQEGSRIPVGYERPPTGGLRPIAGGPADPALKADNIPAQVQQRRQAVISQGLNPDDPVNRAFILSGRMPRDEPITASDRKAILEADEAVSTTEGVIGALRRAKTLSKNAMGFPGAGAVGQGLSLIGSPVGETTVELDNLVGTNALSQLKTIFGGNPTEGERKILLELQGSSSKTDKVRQAIYDRAIEMANRRLELNRQRAGELRGGTFFRPGGGTSGQTPQGLATPAPMPAPPPAQQSAPVDGARQAPDGNWYVEQNGQFFRVDQ